MFADNLPLYRVPNLCPQMKQLVQASDFPSVEVVYVFLAHYGCLGFQALAERCFQVVGPPLFAYGAHYPSQEGDYEGRLKAGA